MNILRVSALWSGFQGAPGYSNFHFATDPGFFDGGVLGDDDQVAADSAASRVRQAFYGMREYLPDGARVSIEPEVEILNSDTGEILGFVDVEAGSALGTGTGGGWSAASGAVVNWRTNDYRFGRRIRGRTFLVPLSGGAYEDDGTLSTLGRRSLQDFGETMVSEGAAPEFGVWSRPRDGAGGVFATVVSSNVPDMAAVLRSRRD